MGFAKFRGGNRPSGDQLIGNAKDGPKQIDAAQRINHTLIEKIAPQADDNRARQQNSRHPASAAERFPKAAAEFLHHEASYARSGIEHRKDEERFKHDGEVIPNAEK